MGFFGPHYEFLYALTHIETIIIWKYMEVYILRHVFYTRDSFPAP